MTFNFESTLFFILYISTLFFFFYMIPKRHFISVHSLRNEFIQVFNRNEVLVPYANFIPVSYQLKTNCSGLKIKHRVAWGE